MNVIIKILAYPFVSMSKYLFSFSIVKDIAIMVATNEAITFFDLDKKVKKLAEEITADRKLLLESKTVDKNNPYQTLPLNNDVPWISSQFVTEHFETVANTALFVGIGGILYIIENKARKGVSVNASQAKDYIVDQVAKGALKTKQGAKAGADAVKSASKSAKDMAGVKIAGGVASAKVLFESGKKLVAYSLGHLRINAHLLGYMALNFGSFVLKNGKGLSLSVVDLFRTIPFFLTKEQKAKFMLKLVEIAKKTGSRISIKKVNGKAFIYTTMGAGAFGSFIYMMLEYVFNETDAPGATIPIGNMKNVTNNTNLQIGVETNHKKLFLLIGKAISRLSDIRKLQYAGTLESSISTKFGNDRNVRHAAFKMADLIISQLLERLARRGTPSVSTHLLTVTNIIIQILQYLSNPDGVKLSSLRFVSNIVNNIIDYNSGSFSGNKEMFAVNLGVKTDSHIHIDAIVDNQMSNNVVDDESYWQSNSHRYDVIDNNLWDSELAKANSTDNIPSNNVQSGEAIKAKKIGYNGHNDDGNGDDIKLSSSVVSNLRMSLKPVHLEAG